MRHLNDQLTRWAREHPWRWAALGGFALTLISAGLRWALLHRSVEDSLELGGTMGGTWFVLWGPARLAEAARPGPRWARAAR